MLGHSLYDEDKSYAYQTLVDNIGLLTLELLGKINQIIGKRSVAKARQDKIDAQVTQAHQTYIDQAKNHLDKIQGTLTKLAKLNATASTMIRLQYP